ncbi:Predicted ATPase [Actinacidiphila yanglinensis]|uniref:Predicted ATPase n=1 Tax=Actinacidiphila yanglinensis TaxID=310779 RepID=A0A1H6CN75_9ACTN|nr:LuxR family transcriptional regulator [Actinacidiphila yanglinensis]SEG74368.1 Predicted ATPase [Actinacidiphila yanglinensis]
MLHGREAEAGTVEALLAGARAGRSGVLVVRGPAGIGKTALLAHALGQANAPAPAGMTVVRGSGVEFEAELPYAGLELLLRRAMGAIGSVPEPQQRALRAAFGLSAGTPGEPMFVGLAVLSLLSGHAGDGPLLCVVDDAQWLDRASADALAFAARRLDAEGVVMLFAARDGEGSFAARGLPEVRLGGLDEAAAGALLAERGAALGPAVRRRVLAEAQGNPLALLELPLTLDPGGAAGTGGPGPVADVLPLTSRLEAAFHGRVGDLPPGTRTLLLIAAADHTGDPDILLAAATALGVGVDDLPPAQDAGIVLVDEEDRLRFRHPLMRAAIHQRAALPERLAAHRALAEACDPVHDPDHRAWHLAMAATGPDEEVAAALEATAHRARERSGHSAASVAYERAARLSTDAAARAGRLLLAAEAASEAGELPRARDFAEQAARAAGPVLPPGSAAEAVVRARALYVRALADFWQGAFPGAHRMLLEGAGAAAAADPERAGRMLVQAVHTAWYLGADEVDATVRRLAALELPPGTPIRHVAGFLTGALAHPDTEADTGTDTDTDADADADSASPPATVPEAAAAVRAAAGGRTDPRETVMLCAAGLVRGQDAESYELAAALAAECRDSGGVGRLATVLFFRAEVEIFESRLDDALATAAEGLRISRDTQQAQWVSQLSGALAQVAALRGEEEVCRGRVAEALAAAPGAPVAPGAAWAYWSQGLLELGLGRARSALERLELLADPSLRHQISATRSVPDLVEAAVRVGQPARAAEPFARFERWARRAGQGWADAVVARCRALLAPDAQAEAYFTAALAGHDPHRRALETARTELLYGEWLRRARRRSEAAGHLRAALEVFERLGARPWADRARGELGASGAPVTVPQETRSLAEQAGLTPQESQIVRLAAEGLSNKDIAARLFLSPRTVGYHLYKAYPKLGVVSRGELASLVG